MPPVIESRLKAGLLTLDGEAFPHQVNAVSIEPGNSEEDPVEMLSADTLGGGASNEDTLKLKQIQDWDNVAGLSAFSWKNRGTVVPFTWKPNATAGQWAGQVEVQPFTVGGDVNKRLDAEVTWKITSLTPPTGFVPVAADPPEEEEGGGGGGAATPASPGDTFTNAAIDGQDTGNAALLTYTATPSTAWTTGQAITINGSFEFHWDGSAWAGGPAV